MEIFYKAVRSDGFDFYSETVDYASICGTGEWLPELPGGSCCTASVYHASTSKADTLIGGSWPCRIFEVEGEPVSSEKNKRGFKTLRVLRELPAWEALGPNGEAVATLIEKAKTITPQQADQLNAAGDAAGGAAWYAARDAAWYAAGNVARYAAGNAARYATGNAARYATWDAARYATWDAARALMVRDLITEDHFRTLAGPWISVMGEI